jgi:hypothetical protein
MNDMNEVEQTKMIDLINSYRKRKALSLGISESIITPLSNDSIKRIKFS